MKGRLTSRSPRGSASDNSQHEAAALVAFRAPRCPPPALHAVQFPRPHGRETPHAATGLKPLMVIVAVQENLL